MTMPPPRGWPGVPGAGILPLMLAVPTEDGESTERHELQWPPDAHLPRIGDTLTRQTYRSAPGSTYRIITWQHIVLRYEWETRPSHGSISHPMLVALVLVLSDGGEQ